MAGDRPTPSRRRLTIRIRHHHRPVRPSSLHHKMRPSVQAPDPEDGPRRRAAPLSLGRSHPPRSTDEKRREATLLPSSRPRGILAACSGGGATRISGGGWRRLGFEEEVFYSTQYHPIPPVEKDSYLIKKGLVCKDLIVEINSVPPVFLVWYGWYSQVV
jgi:hypothetical protein